jgi:glycogen operon protein
MLATLLTSFGAPLLVAGDEVGRTQSGNNNAYCQDNEISWLDWADADTALLAFTRRAIALRRRHPVLRRRRFLTGVEAQEIEWFTPAGTHMTPENWGDASARCIAVYLDGSDAPDRDENGSLLFDDDLLVLVNGWEARIDFVLPDTRPGNRWTVELDSAVLDATLPAAEPRAPGASMAVHDRSVIVLSSPNAARRGSQHL